MQGSVRVFPLVLALAAMPVGGCASHLITADRPEGSAIAGQPHVAPQTSFAGERGPNSEGATGHVASECRGEPLTQVEVHRNFLQGLVTVLTLGIVSPADIRFFCADAVIPENPDDNAPDDAF